MNGFRTAPPRHAHDPVNAQVALGRRGRTDVIRLIRVAHVQRLAVRVRIDGHRADAHLATGAHHAQGNLAAVGNEDLVEHGPRIRPDPRLISRQPRAASPHGAASKVEYFEPKPGGPKKFLPAERVTNVLACQCGLVPGRLERDEAIPEMVGKSNGSINAGVARGFVEGHRLLHHGGERLGDGQGSTAFSRRACLIHCEPVAPRAYYKCATSAE